MLTSKPKVILIFGDPKAGKSWLADKLQERNKAIVLHLDKIYIEFIRDSFPDLYLPSLNIVVSQHYRTILSQEKEGYKKWKEYVTDVIGAFRKEYTPKELIVEGYLLAPILRAIKTRLKKIADVEVIYVKDRHYYKETCLKDLVI